MTGRLEGKVAVITGCASGIGRASAVRFAAEGAVVIGGDINAEGGAALVSEIEEAGGAVRFLHTDVSEPSQLEALRDAALTGFGQLDVWWNNAFASVFRPIAEQSIEEFDDTVRISLRSYWYGSKIAATHMLDNGGGVILHTASVQSYFGEPGFSAYQAVKHGVLGIARSVGVDCAPLVRSVAIAPGFIHTPAHDGIPADVIERVVASIPARRGAQPDEVASLGVFLASDEASYITATGVVIDGGYLAR